jgi:hypothetical protein
VLFLLYGHGYSIDFGQTRADQEQSCPVTAAFLERRAEHRDRSEVGELREPVERSERIIRHIDRFEGAAGRHHNKRVDQVVRQTEVLDLAAQWQVFELAALYLLPGQRQSVETQVRREAPDFLY